MALSEVAKLENTARNIAAAANDVVYHTASGYLTPERTEKVNQSIHYLKVLVEGLEYVQKR